MAKNRTALLIGLLLSVVTLAVYWQVANHDFLNYDDTAFITHNARVQAGLTLEGLRWAFLSADIDYWHPLATLSHMLDVELFGLHAGKHHLMSVAIHIANTLLLFWVFARLTGARWRSAFVAALFALHPLHVESVAWASERKDVLSALFWLLTLWAYLRYVEKPAAVRYGITLLCFIFALMSKPMVVTLPFALLLLDYWPLGRFRPGISAIKRLLIEKIPFFVLAIMVSVATFLIVNELGIAERLGYVSMGARLSNALVAYTAYLWKMFWPAEMAVVYPYPQSSSAALTGVCGLVLVTITVFAIRLAGSRPYLFFGWFWYLGILFPVIGAVQTGPQAMADRYTYLSLIGLFIIIAWSVPTRLPPKILASAAGIVLLALTGITLKQIPHWQNSVTLFSHAIAVTRDNWIAHDNLGVALAAEGKTREAITHYREALRISPENVGAHNNLGVALRDQGQLDEAIGHFKEALRIKPDFIKTHRNLQAALQIKGTDRPSARSAQSEGLLGATLLGQGKLDEAIEHFHNALEIDFSFAKGHFSLGLAYLLKGDRKAALAEYEILKTSNPSLADNLHKEISRLEDKGGGPP